MTSISTRLCVKCVHHRYNRANKMVCNRNVELITSPIDGKVEKIFQSCDRERGPSTWGDWFSYRTRCGPKGKFFKPLVIDRVVDGRIVQFTWKDDKPVQPREAAE